MSLSGSPQPDEEPAPDSDASASPQESVDDKATEIDGIRYGSPFAVDPVIAAPLPPSKPEVIFDVGPMKYTAMGAVAASAMVLIFAGFAAWWFPGGGTLIAGLGCMLAIFGMFSHYRLRAFGCLALHLMLFMLSYSRALG